MKVRRGSSGLALAVVCIGYAMVVVDTTAVNVALPSIGAALHTGPSALQWVVDAYVLVFASLLVGGGAVADRIGSARAFLAGIAVFTAASIGCAVAPTAGWLIAGRAVQGVGAAFLAPAAMALISQIFPDSPRRAKATAIFVTAAGSPQALGPVLGGVLVGGIGWRSVFWLNVPLALLTAALARRRLPGHSPDGLSHRLRGLLTGQLCALLVCAGVITALIELPRAAADPTIATIAIAVMIPASVLCWHLQRHSDSPPIDRRLLAAPGFIRTVLLGSAVFAAYYGLVFVITLHLQGPLHLSPLAAGLAFLPAALPIFALPLISAPLSVRIGPARLMRIALICLSIGAAVIAIPSARTDLRILELGLAILGTGTGLLVAPQISTAMRAAPRGSTNIASGLLNAARQAGAALGVALIGTTYAASPATSALTFAALLAIAIIGAGWLFTRGNQRTE